MRSTKIIIGIVAILTASSLFAFKGKMMHCKKNKMENCDMKWHKHYFND